MVCEECKQRAATVHLKKIVQGKTDEVHLCDICAREKEQGNLDSQFSIHHFLAGLLEGQSDNYMSLGYHQIEKCQHCGMTYTTFKQTGRVGCQVCYEAFKEKLTPLIRRVQGNIGHRGKVPKRGGGIIRLRKEINQLKGSLQKAIQEEAFEEAARLRDQIREMEGWAEGGQEV